jgi:type II secretory pathway component PulF
MAAGMPLAAGLRAAAAEADSLRLARALRTLAAEVEQGRPLAVSLERIGLPAHLAALIRAGEQGGDLGPLLAEWLENRRAAREQWHSAVAALVYPALSLALMVGVFLLFSLFVVPTFRQLIESLGMRLPLGTRAIFWFTSAAAPVLAAVCGVGLVAAIVLRLLAGRAAWSWLISHLPVLGPIWHWSSATEMLRGLGLLLEQQMPLPEALRVVGDGLRDGFVGAQCHRLATRVEQGTSLTMALVALRTLPLSIVPLVHWGEREHALPEALRSAAELLEGRLKLRSDWMAQVIPPIVFVVVGSMALALVGLIAGTLIPLIRGLT